MSKGVRSSIAAIATTVLLAACTGPSAEPAGGGGTTGKPAAIDVGDITIAVVTHGSAGDAFWDVVKNGAEKAGTDQGVKVTYNSDGDPSKQAQLIDAAVASNASGLVVSMSNPDALEGSIKAAVAKGIPVITINSGEDKSAEFGAITHVGQSELIAGEGAGEKLKDAGATKLLCVIHEAGNIGLEDRCKGAAEKFGDTSTLQVDVNDLTASQSKIKGALQSDSSIDAVLALNPSIAIAAANAVGEQGSEATVATFDLSGDVVNAIKQGAILFAVDQQQYLQGYLPVIFLTLYLTNANTVGGGLPVLTGPGYVTKDNADTVAELAASGTR